MAEGEKKFAQIGQLKEGNYVLIDGVPCRIVEVEKSKPGKHGAAKARITGIGIFSSQKKTLMKPTSADTEVPIIEKASGQVVAVMGDVIQVMDTENYQTYNAPKPKDITGLSSGIEVEFIRWGDSVLISRKKAEK